VSDVAVPAKLSGVVPSPQLTVIPVTVTELETVNVTVTIWPVVAGLGVGALTTTTGTPTGAVTTTDPVAWLVEPLLSVALTVMVYVFAVE
jgi:hypothetical protein